MKVKVAAIQMSADIGGREANVERAERLLIQYIITYYVNR